MGLAEYMIVAQGDEWGVLHDGTKLDELVARVIFPEFEAVPYAR